LGLPETLATSVIETAPCEIWQSNWKTVQLFIAMGTQWRVGMGGATALDYVAIPVVALAMGIKLTKGRLGGLRVMEGEALSVMGEQRKA
jgi:hypothetical protein